jgi:hypothetical protein|tara:strand:+ start:167 stop:445 length:279 start_codon:yes stop_codon:yes gene_type:complete
MEPFSLIADVGAPIAGALIMGFFIFLTLKYILESVTGQVSGMHGIIMSLENRVKTMNNDLIRIDTLISHALKVNPDVERIARADGKVDARRD